jgi:hypothetical protein
MRRPRIKRMVKAIKRTVGVSAKKNMGSKRGWASIIFSIFILANEFIFAGYTIDLRRYNPAHNYFNFLTMAGTEYNNAGNITIFHLFAHNGTLYGNLFSI